MGNKNRRTVTVAELIAALQSLGTPDAVVRMYSDPEGNNLRVLDVVSPDSKKSVSLWPGAWYEE